MPVGGMADTGGGGRSKSVFVTNSTTSRSDDSVSLFFDKKSSQNPLSKSYINDRGL